MKTTLSKLFIIFSILLITENINAQDYIKIDNNVKTLLNKKKEYNRNTGSKFKIQLYNGNEKRARNIRARFRQIFQSTSSKLKCDLPDWKVQVGNYQTKLDADIDLNKFRKKFQGAIIIEM